MTPAEKNYHRADVRLRIARAQLLLQVASHSWNKDRIADLLTFAAQLGDESAADSVAAFRAAQADLLRAAQAELDRLPGPDGAPPC